jgi:hypothetical protein
MRSLSRRVGSQSTHAIRANYRWQNHAATAVSMPSKFVARFDESYIEDAENRPRNRPRPRPRKTRVKRAAERIRMRKLEKRMENTTGSRTRTRDEDEDEKRKSAAIKLHPRASLAARQPDAALSGYPNDVPTPPITPRSDWSPSPSYIDSSPTKY